MLLGLWQEGTQLGIWMFCAMEATGGLWQGRDRMGSGFYKGHCVTADELGWGGSGRATEKWEALMGVFGVKWVGLIQNWM